jgi:hypothetical protein
MNNKINTLTAKGYHTDQRTNSKALLHDDHNIWVVVTKKRKITCMGKGHAERVFEQLR